MPEPRKTSHYKPHIDRYNTLPSKPLLTTPIPLNHNKPNKTNRPYKPSSHPYTLNTFSIHTLLTIKALTKKSEKSEKTKVIPFINRAFSYHTRGITALNDRQEAYIDETSTSNPLQTNKESTFPTVEYRPFIDDMSIDG
jgi:hypothetical protein